MPETKQMIGNSKNNLSYLYVFIATAPKGTE